MRKIKKGDLVMLLTGGDAAAADEGKKVTGKVLKVFPAEDRIIVEGVNMQERHTKPTQQLPQGGIIKKEAPIHISNVMLIAPKSNKPTRVGFKILKDGTKVRVAKNPECDGEEIN